MQNKYMKTDLWNTCIYIYIYIYIDYIYIYMLYNTECRTPCKTNIWKQIFENRSLKHIWPMRKTPTSCLEEAPRGVDRIQNPGCRILGRESWTLNPGTRILDPESWIHHPPPQPYCHRVNWHDPTTHPNPTVCGTDIKTSRHNPSAHIKTHQGIKLKTQHKHNSTRTKELERASKSHKSPNVTGTAPLRRQDCKNVRI